MNTAQTKIEIVQEILKIENKKLLSHILTLAKSNSHDFWDDLTPYEKEMIEASLQEVNDGKTIPYEKVMKKYRK